MINNCIVCKSELEEDTIIVGNQFPSAIFANKNEDYTQSIDSSSLNLTRCSNDSCSLVQLSNDYDLDIVFQNYPYISGTTATMKSILEDVVDEGIEVSKPKNNDVILDIGGNDGTMLSYIDQEVGHKVNIDAAHGVDSVDIPGKYTKIEGLFNKDTYENIESKKPKLIFSVAMFYHLNNPLIFCNDIASIMDNESIWVVQMTYLGSMLRDNIYDNIVHEHKAYYSIHSLEYLLKQCGLHICGAKVVNSYGGSIRVYIKKNKDKITTNDLYDKYIDLKESEEKDFINKQIALKLFNERMQLLKVCSSNLIEHIVEKEGKIHAIGASTKGNMICQFAEINNNLIECVLDNNEKKIGKIMTGSDIPIVNEDDWVDNLTKYILVLPYYYVDFFSEMLSKHIRIGESKYLVVLLPFPKLIKVEGAKK
jgi:hypothetical protein